MFFNSHAHIRMNDSVVIVNESINNIELMDYYSIGIHPWVTISMTEDNFLKIQQLASKKNCLAIGEIGLDKLKGPDFEIQKEVFTKQILIAEKMELPVILHCVKAWNEVLTIKTATKPKQQWIFHGFNKVGILKSVVEQGLIISIGASILTNEKLQEVLCLIPNDQLLLETDDVPIDIFEIYKKVSEIKQISLQALEQIIEENFKRTFKKWQIGWNAQNC